MRIFWFSRRPERRRPGSAARRRAGVSPLSVRRLERRRVLDASITSIVVPAVVAEGDTVSSSGTGTGTGTLSFEWSVKQGFDTIATGSGPAFDFVPPDDGTYEVQLQLFDSDQTSDIETRTLTVTNVEPTVEFLTVTTPIDENGTATLSGTYSDPGLLDTHELDIDWNGDGVFDQTVGVSGGAFSVDRQYLDDDPTATPTDANNIFVRLRDDDGGVGTAAVQVTVNNVAPTIENLDATDVNESGVSKLTGTIVDPGTQDTFTLEVDWGDGTIETFTYGSGTTDFEETHQYLDDNPSGTPFDTYVIQVTVTDDDGGSGGAETSVVVSNNTATLGNDLSAANVNENGTATLFGSIVDPGSQDTFTLEVDWGDGTVETFTYGAGSDGFSETHQYLDDDPSATSSDPYVIKVKLKDDDGGEDTATLSITVTNVAPQIEGLAATDVAENGVTNLTGSIIDPGTQDTFTLEVNWGDGVIETFTYGAGTTSFSETHQYLDDDPTGTASDAHTISVTLVDDDSGEATDDVTIRVSNVAPAIGQDLAATSVNENGTTTLSGSIVDPGTQDTFTLEVNWGDGTIETFTYGAGTTSFSETHQYLDDDPTGTASEAYTINVKLVDDDTGEDTASVSITVSNVTPALENVVAGDVNENGATTLTGNIVDPGTQDTFTLEVNWGDGTIETFTYGTGTTSFSETHQYLDDNPTGTASDEHTITLKLVDDDAGMDSDEVTITVSNVAPDLQNVGANNVVENGATTLTGNIVDPGTQDTFTLEVNWGDGTIETFTYAAGTTSFSETHQYLDDDPTGTASDTRTISVTIVDDDTGMDTDSVSITVSNVAPAFTSIFAVDVNENGVTTLSGEFADPGTQDTFTLEVNWADGTVETFTYAAGTTSFSETHQYLDDDPTGTESDLHTITLTLTDDDTGMDAGDVSITVSNVAPVLGGLSDQMVNEGASLNLTGSGGTPSLATFTDIGTLDTHTATINWGDGSAAEAATVAQGNGSGSLGGSHIYADNGTYTVTVTLVDDDGGTHVQTFDVTVNNVDPSLTGIENVQVNEGEAFVLTSDGNDLTTNLGVGVADPGFANPNNPNAQPGGSVETLASFTIDWGDGTAQTAVAIADLDDGGPGAATTAGFNHAPHTYADNGTYAVKITLQDDDGAVVTREFTITVNNVAPTLEQIVDLTINESDTLQLTDLGQFTDPGFNNPLNAGNVANGGETIETFTYSIDWGDGTTADGGAATIDALGGVGVLTAGSFDGAHTYADNGVYTVSVTVMDDDLGSHTITFIVTVNNIAPQFEPVDGVPFQPGDDRFEGTDVTAEGFTTIRVAFSDPGFDNPLNAGNASNGGETAETFTYLVNWGDGTTDTIEVVFVAPGVPVVVNAQTSVLMSLRAPGDAITLTTGEFEVTHRYLGPPDPANPTKPIPITLTLMDDDGGEVSETIEVQNPGIETVNVAIDTTPDVPRLVVTPPPPMGVFIVGQNTSTESLQTLDATVATSEMVAAAERYLELRVVYPDGSESEGYRLKDEVLLDLRKLFASLPDGRYKIYLVRTENNSRRLVMEVDVRNGRVIDPSDDSEGTRDRPPTSETAPAPEAAPLDENPLLEQVPEDQGAPESAELPAGEAAAANGERESGIQIGVESWRGEMVGEFDHALRWGAGTRHAQAWAGGLVGVGLAAAGGWSTRVNAALEEADEDAWKRLRRAGRLGRVFRR